MNIKNPAISNNHLSSIVKYLMSIINGCQEKIPGKVLSTNNLTDKFKEFIESEDFMTPELRNEFDIINSTENLFRNQVYTCMETMLSMIEYLCTQLNIGNISNISNNGDVYTWDELVANDTVVVTNNVVTSVNGISGLVIIPEGITNIGSAFSGTDITKMYLPSTITKIDINAFKNCTSLTHVEIPDTINTIGEFAFYSCIKLTKIHLPDSITTIKDYAFGSCINLEDINLSNVKNIGLGVFDKCISIKNADISSASIMSSIFKGCTSLETAILNTNLNEIKSMMFQDCTSLKEVIIPDNVTRIGEYTFGGCTNLININIPDNVSGFGSGAFYKCQSLEYIELPDELTTIPDRLFSNCMNLKSITIPDSVTSIGEKSFEKCISLEYIYIPHNVTYIADNAFVSSGIKYIGMSPDNLLYDEWKNKDYINIKTI